MKDKVFLIIGSSSGLGRKTCILDSFGAKVIAVAGREDRLKELKDECKNLDYKVYDLSSQTEIKNLVDEIVNQYGKINVMAYFDGILCIKPLRMVDIEEAKKFSI